MPFKYCFIKLKDPDNIDLSNEIKAKLLDTKATMHVGTIYDYFDISQSDEEEQEDFNQGVSDQS